MADADPKTDRPRLRIILEPLPDGVPWPVRVRRALKMLLRTYRLKCMGFEEVPVRPPAKDEPQDKAD